MTAMGSKMVGIQQDQSDIVSLAIDPTSGGKTILTEWHNLVEGSTATGAIVPHSRIPYHDMVRFDFDDAGLIVGFTCIGDDGVLDTIRHKVRELPGKRNAATAMKFGAAFQKLNGAKITPEVMAGISQELVSMTVPKMACAWAPGTKHGVDLEGVSVDDCLKALGSICSPGTARVVSQDFSSLAIDPNNGGKTVIIEFRNVVDASGTRFTYPDVMRLDFDDEGLVVAMKMIGDDGVMAAAQGEATALAVSTPNLVTCGTAIGLVVFGASLGA